MEGGAGGLSHTRWRLRGQSWHSWDEEWKTFSPENRVAVTSIGKVEGPWVTLRP